MARRYYSARNRSKELTLEELYRKLQHLYSFFLKKDYFEGKAGITEEHLPELIEHKAAIALGFQPFPIMKWQEEDITDDHVFDVIEFLYDHVSKPGERVQMIDEETGWDYYVYDSYDDAAGQVEFREHANLFLCDYKTAFEITEEGTILALGSHGLQHILDAEIVLYDEKNVDSKVRNAILKWRNRRLDAGERREAIREMADVFEWLKKTKQLQKVLRRKDEADLFNIANNFHLRHHDPRQKKDYDTSIWYAWIFHFYLATYHAVIRLLKKEEEHT